MTSADDASSDVSKLLGLTLVMTSARQVDACEARGKRVSTREKKLRRVVARVGRDWRSNNFERRVGALAVSDGSEASTSL